MARKIFCSFHYKPDYWRASQVRSIGAIEGNKLATDNDWETVTQSGDQAIKNWINNQLKGRTCTVVLIGENTANRKWINYEVSRSWNEGMGVVGIHIHGLKNKDGYISEKGKNPLDYVNFKNGVKLSTVAKTYNPQGTNSKQRYAWIQEYLGAAIDEAIAIRKKN